MDNIYKIERRSSQNGIKVNSRSRYGVYLVPIIECLQKTY